MGSTTPVTASSTDPYHNNFWLRRIAKLLTGNEPSTDERISGQDIETIAGRIGAEHRAQVEKLRELRRLAQEDEDLYQAARGLIRVWRSTVVETDSVRLDPATVVLRMVGPMTQVMDAHAARSAR